MIILPIVIFLINFLVLIFTMRYNMHIIILVEVSSLLLMYIYLLFKRKKEYINYKELLTCFLMIIIQALLYYLFNRFDLIVYPSGVSGAIQTIYTIFFFFTFDIVYLLLLLATNFIKFLINKLKE